MKIKICGIKNIDEVNIINETMPDFAGFILTKSKREVSFETALELSKQISSKIKKVGVFADANEETIIKYFDSKIIDIAQLHNEAYDEKIITNLQKRGLGVIKVIRVKNKDLEITTNADYVLFDTYDKELIGGTNKTFNSNVKLKSNKPFFVAGGINEENATNIIEKFHPFGVDVSSGAETNGFKTKEKVSNIINIVRNKNL